MSPRRLLTTTLCLLALCACAGAQTQSPGGEARDPSLESDRIVTADGYALPLGRWLPDEPPERVVLALHGFNDFHQSHEPLATRLARQGSAVYAYDQRGFGSTEQQGIWPGTDRLVADARLALRLLRERYPDRPIYLLGESMGAAVAMLAATEPPVPDIEGLVLMAPAVWGRDIQPWYQRLGLWLGLRVSPGLRLDSDWVNVDPTDDPDWDAYWKEHPLVLRESRVDALAGISRLMDRALSATGWLTRPTLMLYGGEDEVIPPEAVCAMLERLPDEPAAPIRFAFYPDGWHFLTRDSRGDETVRDVEAWLADRDGPLPSGRTFAIEQARNRLCPD